jgi:hypothetical protein
MTNNHEEVHDRSTQQKEETMKAQKIEGAVALATGANPASAEY